MTPMILFSRSVMPFLILMVSLSLGAVIAPARADSGPVSRSEYEALRNDLETIKGSLASITKELEILRQPVTQRSVPLARTPDMIAKVNVAGSPMLGNTEAPLTLVEFSDYQCPFCARFRQTTFPALKAEFIDTGKLRYIFRDFPLERIHPHARKAAEAAHCAGDQGKYWEMHDLLFQHQKALQFEQLKAYASTVGLDPEAFATCLREGKFTAEVQRDLDDGAAAGVQGTPGFFLGKTRPDDTIQGVFIRGAQPIAAFRSVIERLLDEKEN